MSLIYQSTDIVRYTTAVDTSTTPALVSHDYFHLAPGAAVVSTNADGFESFDDLISRYDWNIEGRVLGQNYGIYIYEPNVDDGRMTVEVGPSGLISGGGSRGIFMQLGNSAEPTAEISVINQGTITGEQGARLSGAANVTVLNSGLMDANSVAGATNALQIDNVEEGHVVNSGTLRTMSAPGSFPNSSAALAFINSSATADFTLHNTGLISGPEWALSVRSATTDITNAGFIDGHIQVSSPVPASVQFHNSATGQIDGDVTLSEPATMVNRGAIRGDVALSGDGDSFDGFGGTVTGSFMGGGGDDVFRIDQPGAMLDGGPGNDTVFLRGDLRQVTNVELIELLGSEGHTVLDDDTATRINGNAGDDVLMGAGGNDTLLGRQGIDDLQGGDGDDLIIGNSGDDEIDGGNGADQLFGGRGADQIIGGYGNDFLVGGAGDDTINPGGAEDTMTGGYGADVFQFDSAADAGSGGNADRIDNFARGEDVIDLIALGTTPASFIGTSGFSAGGNMEVRYTVNPFGNALVRIDEDGNGTEDARIVVSQTAMLDAGDFLL